MSIWNDSDDALLTKLYKDDKLDFLPLCTKLKRKCKDVKQRIIYLKLKSHNYNIRGYNSNKVDNYNTDNTNRSNNTDITTITDKSDNKLITTRSNTDLKTPTEDLRKQTNIIFDQIDNIYQAFNSISNIYTNITNITNTSKQDV
jgi:hypothetical protein